MLRSHFTVPRPFSLFPFYMHKLTFLSILLKKLNFDKNRNKHKRSQ
uniref:Uncharacterized protein n=1 Tax=Rhizophora mucronata TaxID=61149 RepID=A0A2P2L0K4_RHIMU